MYPCYTERYAFVFYAVAGFFVVFHYFACTAVAVGINLEEDDASVFSDSEVVLGYRSFNSARVEDCVQKFNQCAAYIRSDGLFNELPGNCAWHCCMAFMT